jgi:hypothetical protein
LTSRLAIVDLTITPSYTTAITTALAAVPATASTSATLILPPISSIHNFNPFSRTRANLTNLKDFI